MQSIVNNSEISTLKEMIFQRIENRSKTEQNNYQLDFLNDVKNSLGSSRNPFCTINNDNNMQDLQNNNSISDNEKLNVIKDNQDEHADIGFKIPDKNLSDIKLQTLKKMNIQINQLLSSDIIHHNMLVASRNLYNNTEFHEAIEYLNSKNTILYNDKFKIDIVA